MSKYHYIFFVSILTLFLAFWGLFRIILGQMVSCSNQFLSPNQTTVLVVLLLRLGLLLNCDNKIQQIVDVSQSHVHKT